MGGYILMSQLLGTSRFSRTVRNLPLSQMRGVLPVQVILQFVSLRIFSYHHSCLLAVITISDASKQFFFHRLPLVKLIQPAGSIPIKKLIYSKYICSLSLQLHCVFCNLQCIRLLTPASYNKTLGLLILRDDFFYCLHSCRLIEQQIQGKRPLLQAVNIGASSNTYLFKYLFIKTK